MDRAEGGLFLIPLLVVGVVAVLLAPGGGGGAGSATAGSSSKAPEALEASGSRGNLIHEFLGIEAGRESRAAPSAKDCRQRRNRTGEEGGEAGAGKDPLHGDLQWCVRHLIALVPDPLESRFDYTFDRHLDAIQRAVEGAGFVIDRFDLPWTDRPRKSGGSTTEKERQLSRPVDYDNAALRHLVEPGQLLFRRTTRSSHELLVVHLVGETPTSGINKRVFRKALDAAAADVDSEIPQEDTIICAGHLPRCGSTSGSIDVLGPSFSGSAISVRIALHAWRVEPGPDGEGPGERSRRLPVRFISGSATAIGSSAFAGPTLNATFKATVIPDHVAMKAFYHYLTNGLGADHRQIAILSEANTAFGRQLAIKGEPASGEVPLGMDDVLKLYFPLHIADLRSAAAEAAATRGRPARPDDALRPSAVPLPLQEHVRPEDIPPSVSSEDPSSTEAVLRLLLSAIARERILYVGIIATDVKDMIFLTGEIREHCPNVRIFTFASDVLYLHPDHNPALRGMFVITPYTLLPAMQLWTPPFRGTRRRQTFADQTAEGVFNAVSYLLGSKDQMLDYGPPDLKRVASKGSPPDLHPVIWLTAVGANGLYPLELLEEYLRTAKSEDISEEDTILTIDAIAPIKDARDSPRSLLRGLVGREGALGFFLISLAGLIGAIGLLRGAPRENQRPEDLTPKWGRISLLEEAADPTLTIERRSFLFAIGATLLILCSFVGLLVAMPVRVALGLSALELPNDLIATGWIIAVAVSVVTLVLLLWAIINILRRPVGPARPDEFGKKVPPPPQPLRLLSHPLAVITLVMLVLAVYRAGAWMMMTPDYLVLPLFLRSSDLGSGLSPVFPLLLLAAGGVLYAGCHLRRLRLAEHPGTARDEGGIYLPAEGSIKAASNLEAKVRHHLVVNALQLRGAWVIAIILVIAALFVFFVQRWWPAEEAGLLPSNPWARRLIGWPILLLFPLAFTGVYLGLLLTLLRMVIVWIETRRLLTQLAAHPVYPAFLRIRDMTPGKKIGPGRPEGLLVSLTRSVSFAARLHVRGALQSLHSAQAAAKECLEGMVDRDWRARLSARAKADRALATITRSTVIALEHHWPAARLGTNPAREQTEDYVASRVVALLETIIPQIRNLAACSTVGLLLMLMTVSVYPFQNRDALLYFSWPVVLVAVAVTLTVWTQMNRDTLLSDLAGLPPGRTHWDRDFILRLAFYGFLPLAGLLGAQSPGKSSGLIPWLQQLAGMAHP
jgi:hypothetical protein